MRESIVGSWPCGRGLPLASVRSTVMPPTIVRSASGVPAGQSVLMSTGLPSRNSTASPCSASLEDASPLSPASRMSVPSSMPSASGPSGASEPELSATSSPAPSVSEPAASPSLGLPAEASLAGSPSPGVAAGWPKTAPCCSPTAWVGSMVVGSVCPSPEANADSGTILIASSAAIKYASRLFFVRGFTTTSING